MKYLIVFISSIFFITTLNAEPNDSVQIYGKSYFEHYQQKDFDWILDNLDIYLRMSKKFVGHKDKKRHLRDSSAIVDEVDLMKYKRTLKDDYGIKGLIASSEYVRTVQYVYTNGAAVLRKKKKTGIRIVFKDKEGQLYYMYPGHWERHPNGDWAFEGQKTTAYFYGKANRGYAFLNFRKGDVQSVASVYDSKAVREKEEAQRRKESIKRNAEHESAYKEYQKKLETDSLLPPFPKRAPTEEIFVYVEQQAEYPGGQDALKQYFKKKKVYPRLAKRKGVEGVVYISFMIDEDGELVHPRIAKDIGYGCGEEALALFTTGQKWSGQKWRPAKTNGEAVHSEYVVPVRFKLKNRDDRQ